MSVATTTRAGSYLTPGSPSTLDNLGALTYGLHVRIDSVAANDYGLMGIGTFAGQTRKDFNFDTTAGSLAFQVDKSTADATAFGIWSPAAGTKYVLVVAWDGASAPKLYAGAYGAGIAELSYSGTPTNGSGTVKDSSASTFAIGNIGQLDRSVIGAIGLAAVWNRGLSASEVADFYTGYVQPSGNVGLWRPNGLAKVYDQSGVGNDATFVGAWSVAEDFPARPWVGRERKLKPRPFAPTRASRRPMVAF